VAERSVVAASFALLGHVRWLWILAAIVLESASMAAFAIMQRRLLAAGGASVGIRTMLATTYAANAVSVSVPLAGPELATAFAFRRFTRQGADAPLAGWSLLAGWVVSSAAAALVAAGAGLASGNVLLAAVAVRAACSPPRSSPGSRPPRAGQSCAARSNEVPHGYHGTRAVCYGAPSAIPDRRSGPGLTGWARSSFPYRAGRR